MIGLDEIRVPCPLRLRALVLAHRFAQIIFAEFPSSIPHRLATISRRSLMCSSIARRASSDRVGLRGSPGLVDLSFSLMADHRFRWPMPSLIWVKGRRPARSRRSPAHTLAHSRPWAEAAPVPLTAWTGF